MLSEQQLRRLVPQGGRCGGEHAAALIADVARRPAANGPLRYGLSAFVIARLNEDRRLVLAL